ncbi:hypothetical protein BKA62DRAFT_689314 [Auriculariales sp. MPI-PUGE-AT-0066]|nr:hypothetical protein BKA62DRAFT_689314 [Auriculariales sp. MPI-PUGE-AT-0066]
MHRLVLAARFARTTRALRASPLRLGYSARTLSSLEALRVVRSALKHGEDAELALQEALGMQPPRPPIFTAILPTGDTQDMPIESEFSSTSNSSSSDFESNSEAEMLQRELEEFEREEAEHSGGEDTPQLYQPDLYIPPPIREPDMRLVNQHFGAYPRLAAHALLHGHMRAGRLLEAGALAYIQLKHGVKISPSTLELLVEGLCPPETTLPGIPFKPTIAIDAAENHRVFGEELNKMERDIDLGTALARLLLHTAREHQSPRSWHMYLKLVDGILVQKRFTTAASVYSQLCTDWQLHLELVRQKSLATGIEQSVPEQSDAAVEEPVVPTTEIATQTPPEPDSLPDPEYEPPWTSEDMEQAEKLGLANPKLSLPKPHRRIFTRVISAVLWPQDIDIKRPGKRVAVEPTWDRDAVIAIFLLAELAERRRLPLVDISPLIMAAEEAINAGTHGIPIRIYRGGQLRRVKAQDHIDSVVRGLLREPVVREHQIGAWDLMKPFPVAVYNELLGFGLHRKVPQYDLEALVDGMKQAGVEANEKTAQMLFQRSKLAQNKLVDALSKRIKSKHDV